MARASGVKRDLRKDEPYLCYADNWDGQGAPAVKFKVPDRAPAATSTAAILVRLEEMQPVDRTSSTSSSTTSPPGRSTCCADGKHVTARQGARSTARSKG